MSMAYVRNLYDVPAKRGMRVKVNGLAGRIVSSRGQYLGVRFDLDSAHTRYVHPTWNVEYPETER